MKGKANWFKRHTGILAILGFVIIAGLATSTVLLATAKHSPTTKQQTASKVSSQSVTNNTPVASNNNQTLSTAYKLTVCTSGATQTIGNGNYLVGTDIAPGSYKIESQN